MNVKKKIAMLVAFNGMRQDSLMHVETKKLR